MTAWHRGPLIAVDTETTCADPNAARIVTATLIEVGPEGITRTREWLVDPGVDTPAGAAAVHGITTEQAREDGMAAETAVFEIAAELGIWLRKGLPVVGFNVAYDFTVLDRECRRHGIDPLSVRLDSVSPVIDAHVLDRTVDKYRRGKRTLEATAAHYGIRLTGAHDASADALAAARLAYRLAETYPDQLQVPLEQLHAQQVAWRAEQRASLADYFMRQGKPADVNGEWPVISLPESWDPAFHPVDDEAVAS